MPGPGALFDPAYGSADPRNNWPGPATPPGPASYPGSPAQGSSIGPLSGLALILPLQIAAPVLLVLGLTLPENETRGFSQYLAWAIFAVAMSLIPPVVTPLARPGNSAERIRQLTLIATAGLIAYWVIVVLPGVTSNTGFLQTVGVGCCAAATWLLCQRRGVR